MTNQHPVPVSGEDQPDLRVAAAARVGLVPQEWSPGGNRCMKATDGKTGRCHKRARWLDVAAGERYDRYDFTNREPGSYAYKVCNWHAARMVAAEFCRRAAVERAGHSVVQEDRP